MIVVVGFCECGESVVIDRPERAVEVMRAHAEAEHPGMPLAEVVSFKHRGITVEPGTLIGGDGQLRILA